MKFPPSEFIGHVRNPEGQSFSLQFYGENEGAAVVDGPSPPADGRVYHVPEVHREPATDRDDAKRKLALWMKAQGWSTYID